jgi:arylsulfatase A-like enzyme
VYKPAAPSVATVMREAGYHTAYFGKWHCGIVRDQVPQELASDARFRGGSRERTPEYHRAGFQDWFGFENLNQHFHSSYYHNDELYPRTVEGYETDGFTDLVLKYMKEYDGDKPLFLVLSVTPPHFPLIVPDKWRRFEPETLEVRENFTDTPKMREQLAQYYAMIENLDWNIGRLTEAIDSLPGFEDTLTVYFSDHGDYMGSHGYFNRKEHAHEESIRIPAIFRRPGVIPAQGLVDGLFSIVDLMATTLALAGVDIPAWSQGSDFSPRILGHDWADEPLHTLIEMVGSPRWNLDMPDWRGLVTEQYKYVYYETGVQLLYDLRTDPCEMHNLAGREPELCIEMSEVVLSLQRHYREPFFDVIIQHGVTPLGPVRDANGRDYPQPPRPTAWDTGE